MPKNNLEDLRNHLFVQLERFDDEDLDLEQEIQRAQAVAQVASAIVNAAKVEISYLKLTGRGESEFLKKKELKPIEIKNTAPKQIANYSQADACITIATAQGHTAAEAKNCKNYSVGCKNCPFA